MRSLTVGLTAAQYCHLAAEYGAAEPPLTQLHGCAACEEEAAALAARREREKERIVAIDSKRLPDGDVWFIMSEVRVREERRGAPLRTHSSRAHAHAHVRAPPLSHQVWLKSWRDFIDSSTSAPSDGTGRGVLPPGPVDNARLLGKDGKPLPNMRASMHYRGVNKKVRAGAGAGAGGERGGVQQCARRRLRPPLPLPRAPRQVWQFLEGIYGGGPVLKRSKLDLYAEALP